jgi:hypothetical protein
MASSRHYSVLRLLHHCASGLFIPQRRSQQHQESRSLARCPAKVLRLQLRVSCTSRFLYPSYRPPLCLGLIFPSSSLTEIDNFQLSLVPQTWLAASVIVDVGITALLCIVLSRKRGGGFKSTDSLLRRLSFLSIQSASYTSIIAITAAVLAFGTSCSPSCQRCWRHSFPFNSN